MPVSPKTLNNFLCGASRIAVLAIGSMLRADDAAGLLAAQEARHGCKKNATTVGRIRFYFGHTAPENLTGPIRRFKPTHLVVLDAVDFDRSAGYTACVDRRRVLKTSANTHKMPLSVLGAYFNASFACRTLLLGIQPETITAMGSVSPPVRSAASKLGRLLARALIGTLKKASASGLRAAASRRSRRLFGIHK